MIKIDRLKASIDDKEILKGIDLEIPAGEVHVIMEEMVLAKAH